MNKQTLVFVLYCYLIGNHWCVQDAVLQWNAVMLQVSANDLDPTIVSLPDQKSSTQASRAFAIVHAAIHDAVNTFSKKFQPYLSYESSRGIKTNKQLQQAVEAAIGQAANDTLCQLYPKQKYLITFALQSFLQGIPAGRAKRNGIKVGRKIAKKILISRENDGSNQTITYTPINAVGYHQEDPLHPNQNFSVPYWGKVRPFVLKNGAQFRASAIVGTTIQSRLAYLKTSTFLSNYNEVKAIGSKTSSTRTADQTEIGIFWGYDEQPKIGSSPKLFNQATRAIAMTKGNTLIENARLFALINIALADASIACWDSKYYYSFWRPIIGIRNANKIGSKKLVEDPNWEPLGSAVDFGNATQFTPPFPTYTSSHAALGGATFQILRRFYGTDDIAFQFQSDEYDGETINDKGKTRPVRIRQYKSLTQAEKEVFHSRIYIGVHWRLDQEQGQKQGTQLANYAFDKILLPS
ncbi:unnamed protein product [Didymodactylos carnosus]|uniref:Vanadium chloroperoxidase N-terminal domain-containing protein n=1 Tax=Didymodactylos carnosus TaxID=1234261 RepID=A0A815R5Z3_9BILA|nr:unnamed protein product [Didymodactylos carnosus]CAF1472879.1 unnamed protein product [Didymodactylos carnosus]CAF3992848.1 unnamed protein product [Didymodactylos carnosus]CAF4340012.1 unnamed protein product [Didymodactylos carnosus]